MKILLSGGIKTQNIVSGIQKKFSASGDDFIVIEYLDDIENIFSTGEFFDKALVTEQSITKDYTITDEFTIRQRINNFATSMKMKPRKFNFVFLAQTDEMANTIHEEILPILSESAVVVKKPPYTVPFFISILVTDSKQLPEELVYTPDLTVNEVNTQVDDTSVFEDMNDFSSTNVSKVAPDNFDLELFGSTSDTSGDFKVTDELSLDNGVEDIGVPLGDIDIPDFEAEYNSVQIEDIPIEEEIPVEVSDVYSPQEQMKFNNNWGEQNINMEGINPIVQSGEFNDYIDNSQNTNFEQQDNSYSQVDNYNEQSNSGYIPGFDEPESNQYNNMIDDSDYVNNDVYQPENNNGYVQDNPGEVMYNNAIAPESEYTNYNTDQFNTGFNDYNQDNMLPGFDTSDYANDNSQYEYQNNTENNMYEQEEQAGFSASDYEQTYSQGYQDGGMQQDYNNSGMQQNSIVNIQKNDEQPKQGKKGLLGKLGVGGKNAVANQSNELQQNNTKQSAMMNNTIGLGKANPNSVKKALQPFAARGNSIVVTGCGGCGTSTVAYSLASIVTQLGYTALLVDMDTEGRTQSYISKDNYESMEPDGANLMSAVNSSTGINTHISVVRQGFHLLTMGLGTDTAPVNELLHKEKLSRFINLAKTSHNFVIYDVPFASAVGFLSDITYMSDNVVLVTDASNWGITKTMLAVCNIPSEDMQDTVFNRAQFVFNKFRNLNKVLGKKVRTCVDITKVMDQKVLELVGDDPGFHFEDLHIAGIINDDPSFEQGWFEDVQYVDTKKGQAIFLELIEKIVLNK